MTRFVLDASVAASWCLRSFEDPDALPLLDSLMGGGSALAPSIWPYELANTLWAAVRHELLPAASADELVELFRSLPIEVEPTAQPQVLEQVRRMAQDHSLTVYDAAYLELAARERLPLATLDRSLQIAAERVGVPTL